MSEGLKISGKKLMIPDQIQEDWNFSLRPGGWIIAECPSKNIRKKFMLYEYRGHFSLSLNGFLWWGEKFQESRGTGVRVSAGDADLVAQFPGKVRKILVTPAMTVQEGEPLLLIEAMKMEFAIRAPYSGKVSRIWVQEGQQLSPGDRFVDLEAMENGK